MLDGKQPQYCSPPSPLPTTTTTTTTVMWDSSPCVGVEPEEVRRRLMRRNLISQSRISPCCSHPSHEDSVDTDTNASASGLLLCCQFLLNFQLCINAHIS